MFTIILLLGTICFRVVSLTPTVSTFYDASLKYDCSKAEYGRCVQLADPLIRDPTLIFPDTQEDIEQVCRIWNQFVDCIKRYIDFCFTDQQRRVFNKAVENPIESVHQMCTQTSYQTEYLRYASCIKSTVTEQSHCGPQYALLVEQVSKGGGISRASLCCSHHTFKQCVYRETQRLCDGGNPNGNAARFSNQIIDKALSFLQDQCYNYIPNSGDCPMTASTMDQLYIGSGSTREYSASGPDVTAWQGSSNSEHSMAGARTTSNLAPSPSFSGEHPETMTWSTAVESEVDRKTVQGNEALPSRDGDMDTTLGGRTRPSSYSRSSSAGWTPTSPSDPSGQTAPTTTTTARPDWATMSTWHIYTDDEHEKNGIGTETWYPAAGSYVGNSIDEPNQQGLSKPANNFASIQTKPFQFHLQILIVTIIFSLPVVLYL